jgi:hypothetical protein
MSVDKFRLIFSSPASSATAFGAAREAVHEWCQSPEGNGQAQDLAALSHTAASSADGGQAERWQLRECLTLTVYAPACSASTWFWVEAGSREASGLIQILLGSVEARDSLARLASEPVRVGADQVDGLIDVLCDPERRLPAMVATAHPEVPFGPWAATIRRVTRDSSGLASTYILDEPGTAAFNEALGESHGVWGGALRTYLPKVDPAQPGDQRRHHVMLASRIRFDPRRVSAVLADLPQRLALEAPIPPALAGVTQLPLAQAGDGADAPRQATDGEEPGREQSAGREAGSQEPTSGETGSKEPRRLATSSQEPYGLEVAGDGLARWELGRLEAGSPELALELGRQLRRIDQLRMERDEALRLAEQEEERANSLYSERERLLAQLAEREQEVLRRDGIARTLQQRLIAAGVAADSPIPLEAPPEAPPADFAELLDWVDRHLPRVAYTGDIGSPLSLDSSPESSTWVRISWEALRALQAYAERKAEHGFAGDFRAWCVSPPSSDDAIISPGKVRMDESDTVHSRARWRQERVFRVPPEADPDGRVFMGAHIAIGASGSGRVDPRLYFHDGVLKTGQIYVGYIGRHLTNTLSLIP